MCYITWSIRRVDSSQCNQYDSKPLVSVSISQKAGQWILIWDMNYNKSINSAHSITVKARFKCKISMVNYRINVYDKFNSAKTETRLKRNLFSGHLIFRLSRFYRNKICTLALIVKSRKRTYWGHRQNYVLEMFTIFRPKGTWFFLLLRRTVGFHVFY